MVYGKTKGDHILTDVLLVPVLCVCIKITITCEHVPFKHEILLNNNFLNLKLFCKLP